MLLTSDINDLFASQLREWELAGTNYRQLAGVRTKNLDFGGFKIILQFNPERIRSSAAKVDALSIGQRPCFLCGANRPEKQRGLPFDDKYTLLVNPYPIFRRHLTIASNEHIDQRIGNSFSDLLRIAGALPGYMVFYNGPQCGASAPDHLHFQAGERGFMLIEEDFRTKTNIQKADVRSGVEIWLWKEYLRGIITLRGNDRQSLMTVFDGFYNRMAAIQPDRPEPMLNIIAYFDMNGWIIHLIPRKKHRPSQYFETGPGQILVSPASVDLGGVIIVPREDDFRLLNNDIVADIFRQVCFGDNETAGLVN